MLKIRRPLGRLIFNMGIAITGKTVFLIETAPRARWWPPVPRLNIKSIFPRYGDSHVKDKMVGKFPAQMAINAKNSIIWWRHHEDICNYYEDVNRAEHVNTDPVYYCIRARTSRKYNKIWKLINPKIYNNSIPLTLSNMILSLIHEASLLTWINCNTSMDK